MNQTRTSPELIFTSFDKRGSIPKWVGDYGASRDTFQKALATDLDEGIIVVRESSVQKYLSKKPSILKSIAKSNYTGRNCRYVLSVDNVKENKYQAMLHLVDFFPSSMVNNVEISLGEENLESCVWEAVAKHSRQNRNPLAESSLITATTEDLQTKTGRLSAKKVAEVMGLSVAEISSQLKSTRQAVSKTPDAKGLQTKLQPYARIIALRTSLSATKFKKWLNHAFADLDGKTPHDLIACGEIEVVADFAEDALLGTPS